MIKILKVLIPIVIILGILRVVFPPLTELGYTNVSPEVSLKVMFSKKGGNDPMRIYVEAADGIDTNSVSAEICASLVDDMAAGNLPLDGLLPSGMFEIVFVGGGRYFYRFNSKEMISYTYSPEGCIAGALGDG